MGTETGLEIARYLVSAKLAGQAAVAATHLDSSSAVETISTLGEMASEAGSLEEARQLEAAAASAYFAAWSSLRVPFVRRDAARVPEHWLVFEGRRSAVNVGTSRSATDPLNALLNYSYRLVEAEGRLAYLAIGLDPGLGVLHADVKGRDSLVLDVMEAVRPEADRFVLKLVEGRPLLKTDFAEDRRGVLRLLPPLSHRMAEAMPSYARALGPVVEHVATLLASASPYDPAVPSVLTQSKHKAVARRMVETAEPLQRRVAGPNPGGLSPRAKRRQQARRSDQPTLPFAICRGCGADLPVVAPYATPQRRWCDACLPQFRKEEGERLSNEGRAAAEATRAVTGTLPSHDSEAQARRRESNRRERLSRLSWEDEHRATRDTHWYLSSIAPRLSAVSLRAISSATGVSLSAASKFRRGIHVPAPRHWGALAVLVGVASPREP